MTIDVIDLRDFYSQRLGIVARRLINRGIHARWPNAEGQRVLGLGYPTPYLGLFREDSERCIAFMPAAQGVLKWPTERPTLATLVDELSLPLPDAAITRPDGASTRQTSRSSPSGSSDISSAWTSRMRSTAASGSGSENSSTNVAKVGRAVGHFKTPCAAGMKAMQRSLSSRNSPR